MSEKDRTNYTHFLLVYDKSQVFYTQPVTVFEVFKGQVLVISGLSWNHNLMCALKELLITVLFPPLHTGHEEMTLQRELSVSDGGQHPQFCVKMYLKVQPNFYCPSTTAAQQEEAVQRNKKRKL